MNLDYRSARSEERSRPKLPIFGMVMTFLVLMTLAFFLILSWCWWIAFH